MARQRASRGAAKTMAPQTDVDHRLAEDMEPVHGKEREVDHRKALRHFVERGLREVYYHLGKLALNDGDTAKAQEYLRRSGYSDFDHPITLATPFSEDKASGHAFAPRHITEVVPGRVYALSGFEFTEYYFVVSSARTVGTRSTIQTPADRADNLSLLTAPQARNGFGSVATTPRMPGEWPSFAHEGSPGQRSHERWV
jgi:hypothetical protein